MLRRRSDWWADGFLAWALMILTGDKFCRLGEALYGPRWKAVLANMMSRNHRMIQYYCDGKPVPVPLVRKLIIEARTRAAALDRIADELEPYG